MICLKCSECAGRSHHWVANPEFGRIDQVGGLAVLQSLARPTHVCRHCGILGDECDACLGVVVPCLMCDGEGVIPSPSVLPMVDPDHREEIITRVGLILDRPGPDRLALAGRIADRMIADARRDRIDLEGLHPFEFHRTAVRASMDLGPEEGGPAC